MSFNNGNNWDAHLIDRFYFCRNKHSLKEIFEALGVLLQTFEGKKVDGKISWQWQNLVNDKDFKG